MRSFVNAQSRSWEGTKRISPPTRMYGISSRSTRTYIQERDTSGSLQPHVRPTGGFGVVLLCSWCLEQYSSNETLVNIYMTHVCIATYLSRSRLTKYSRKSSALA